LFAVQSFPIIYILSLHDALPILLSICTRASLILSLIGLSSGAALGDEPYTENPGAEGNGDVIIGPDYMIDPDLTDRGNPKGKYLDRKSTRLNSSHRTISYAVFCL